MLFDAASSCRFSSYYFSREAADALVNREQGPFCQEVMVVCPMTRVERPREHVRVVEIPDIDGDGPSAWFRAVATRPPAVVQGADEDHTGGGTIQTMFLECRDLPCAVCAMLPIEETDAEKQIQALLSLENKTLRSVGGGAAGFLASAVNRWTEREWLTSACLTWLQAQWRSHKQRCLQALQREVGGKWLEEKNSAESGREEKTFDKTTWGGGQEGEVYVLGAGDGGRGCAESSGATADADGAPEEGLSSGISEATIAIFHRTRSAVPAFKISQDPSAWFDFFDAEPHDGFLTRHELARAFLLSLKSVRQWDNFQLLSLRRNLDELWERWKPGHDSMTKDEFLKGPASQLAMLLG